MKEKFTEDSIRRCDLPEDVFGLIHDLAYDHEGRDRWQYRERAQEILKVATDASPLKPPLEDVERRAILAVMHKCEGDKIKAAKILGIGKTTLYRKLEIYRRSK